MGNHQNSEFDDNRNVGCEFDRTETIPQVLSISDPSYPIHLIPQSSIRSRTTSKPVITPPIVPVLPYKSQSNTSTMTTTSTISSISSYSATSYNNKTNTNTDNILIKNGITGKFISTKICLIAANFWQENIVDLDMTQQLEIGCSIFFGMLSSSKEMKNVMKKNLTDKKKIESTSLKYLDMMGWLVRCLTRDNIDLYSLLKTLGGFHQKMGIKIQHFSPMLEAMHDTFSYYFPIKYNIEIKYALDEIFTLAAQIMTGQDLKHSSHLNDIAQSFGKNATFLQSLDVCLKSSIGREYFLRYLHQTWCDEIAIFLQSIQRFRNQTSDKERFMVARDIIKTSIKPIATFCVNISYETRCQALHEMEVLEKKFMVKEEFKISADFFKQVEYEINKLIGDNHWSKFVKSIKSLQLQSKSQNE